MPLTPLVVRDKLHLVGLANIENSDVVLQATAVNQREKSYWTAWPDLILHIDG